MVETGSDSDKLTWHGYQRAYPMVFAAAGLSTESQFNMLEIGYGLGRSVKLWETLFPKANIFWIDIGEGLKPNTGNISE